MHNAFIFIFIKLTTIKKITFILLFSLAALTTSYSQTSIFTGVWKGYLLTDTSNVDNRKGLPVTVNIMDDNDKGELYGEMIIQYRYQTDIYKAKYIISGSYEAGENNVFLQQEKLVYYDLLPKGLQWCFGGGNFIVYRNPYKKNNYLDGYMTTNCGSDKMRIVLVKK